MNAATLKILIESYYCTVTFDQTKWSQTEQEAIKFLTDSRLISQDGYDPATRSADFNIQPRGAVFVEHILNLPLPELTWVMSS